MKDCLQIQTFEIIILNKVDKFYIYIYIILKFFHDLMRKLYGIKLNTGYLRVRVAIIVIVVIWRAVFVCIFMNALFRGASFFAPSFANSRDAATVLSGSAQQIAARGFYLRRTRMQWLKSGTIVAGNDSFAKRKWILVCTWV